MPDRTHSHPKMVGRVLHFISVYRATHNGNAPPFIEFSEVEIKLLAQELVDSGERPAQMEGSRIAMKRPSEEITFAGIHIRVIADA